MEKKELITLLAVGDVCVDRVEPDSIFAYVAPVIKDADISFCQLETTYSERGNRAPQCRIPLKANPKNALAIKKAGFNIVSFASNHAFDWGSDAFFDTIKVMEENGINLIGAGKDIEEARKGVVIDKKGVKIAFLAYNSILPMGYWADINKPGCAPIRAFTVYEQVEHDQPGTPARIHTFANEKDKEAMIKDIKAMKNKADIVMVSIHWGIHFTEAEIAMYQREIGHAALDAGADIILGHHAHILKPIEIYKGKAIFYSCCNFAFDLPLPEKVLNSTAWKELMHLNPSWTIDTRYKSYPFPVDSRMSIACRIVVSDKKISRLSILPVLINENSQPRFLKNSEKEFSDVLQYIKKINKAQNIETKFIVEGDEVVIGS
jgi:poly-gamma-glutamate synthesis protein (capsule biosynthesis protein)